MNGVSKILLYLSFFFVVEFLEKYRYNKGRNLIWG